MTMACCWLCQEAGGQLLLRLFSEGNLLAHLIGTLPVGILTCSLANMALSDRMPFTRLMSETCSSDAEGHAQGSTHHVIVNHPKRPRKPA
jgi:hypothetical protein